MFVYISMRVPGLPKNCVKKIVIPVPSGNSGILAAGIYSAAANGTCRVDQFVAADEGK